MSNLSTTETDQPKQTPDCGTPTLDAKGQLAEMYDSEIEIAKYDRVFQNALRRCSAVTPVFTEADENAGVLRKQYTARAKQAAYYGTIAVLVAVLLCVLQEFLVAPVSEANSQNASASIPLLPLIVRTTQKSDSATSPATGSINPSGKDLQAVFLVIEVGIAGYALWVVLAGLFTDVKRGWLRERNKAERCRLLKFGFIINPSGWEKGTTADGMDLSTALSEIEDGSPALESWMRQEPPPTEPRMPDREITNSLTIEILEYYREKRLEKQRAFFKQRAKDCEKSHRRKSPIPTLLFFFSIGCVFIHAVAAFGGNLTSKVLSSVFLILAIGLPAVAAGFRTDIISLEFARNSSRYAAKLHALEELSSRLNRTVEALRCSEDRPLERQAALQDLRFAEYILESDHREWTRLMLEAEWF